MGRPLPHRRALLREVFPLQFLPLSRFLTLLIDFALVISSINIHKLFSPSYRSFLAYRVRGNFAVVLADPVGPEEEIELTIAEFMKFCQENDWRVAFYQTLPDFLHVYRRLGFKKLTTCIFSLVIKG
jgi:hypothetical protein